MEIKTTIEIVKEHYDYEKDVTHSGHIKWCRVDDVTKEVPNILFNILELEKDLKHQEKFNIHQGFSFILRQKLSQLNKELK